MTLSQTMCLLIALAYLAGSIPFGLIVGKMKGIDVRKAGSGNIGATNVARLLGRRFFFLVFFLDLFKGLLPVLTGWFVVGMPDGRLKTCPTAETALWLGIAVAAVLGHIYSLFLKFHGGKGVATSTGVVLGFFPYFTYPALICLGIWIIVFMVWRYVSLGSIVAAGAFPLLFIAFWGVRGHPLLLAASILLAILIIGKHRTNIARLRAGTEMRVGRKTSTN